MSDPARRRFRGKHLLAGGLVCACLLAAIGFGLQRAPLPSSPPLPVPNGFDDLVAAGLSIHGPVPNDPAKADEPTLAAYVAANGEALARARIGLARSCRVPLDESQTTLDAHIKRTSALRGVARLLIAAGRLAEIQGRPTEAARDYREVITLGIAGTRGGLVIDVLTGFACESGGVDGLRRVAGTIDAAHCRELSQAIEPLDRDREEIAAVLARDYGWFHATSGMPMRIYGALFARTLKGINLPAEKSATTAAAKARVRLRTLLASLALRGYRLEHGADPKGMAALVPDYLSTIPRDPTDGEAFRIKGEPGAGVTIDLEPSEGADVKPRAEGRASEDQSGQSESGGEGEGQPAGEGQKSADRGAFGQRG